MSVVYSQNLILGAPSAALPNNPIIGWHNIVSGSGLSATSEQEGFPVSNLATPVTYQRWRGALDDILAQRITLDITYGDYLDYLAVAGHNFSSGGFIVSVEGSGGHSPLVKSMLHFEDEDDIGFDEATGAISWVASGEVEVGLPEEQAYGQQFGRVAHFSAPGGLIATPDRVDFTLGSNPFTIEARVCPELANTEQFLAGQKGNGGYTDDVAWALSLNATNQFVFEVSSDGSSFALALTSATEYELGRPYHVAVIREGDVISLYIDGELEDFGAFVGSVFDSSSPLHLGMSPDWDPYVGFLDEFRLSLTAQWSGESFTVPTLAYPWVALTDQAQLPDDGPVLFRFDPTILSQVRLTLADGTEDPYAAVMYVGKLLILPRRIYVGHHPATLNKKSETLTGKSETGQFLGRITRREFAQTAISMKNIDPVFYRANMKDWVDAARTLPFFFAWRPQSYPLEVTFCWGTDDGVVSNEKANGTMMVSMALQGIVAT